MLTVTCLCLCVQREVLRREPAGRGRAAHEWLHGLPRRRAARHRRRLRPCVAAVPPSRRRRRRPRCRRAALSLPTSRCENGGTGVIVVQQLASAPAGVFCPYQPRLFRLHGGSDKIRQEKWKGKRLTSDDSAATTANRGENNDISAHRMASFYTF